jgi:hypothetical protein
MNGLHRHSISILNPQELEGYVRGLENHNQQQQKEIQNE